MFPHPIITFTPVISLQSHFRFL